MTYKDKYNRISKHIFMLALLPPSPYRFRYVCKVMSEGVMRASQSPVDEYLTKWPWFKAGVAVLKQALFDETKVSSPNELNVSDWAFNQIKEGFKLLVQSLRWYVQRLECSPNRDFDEDGFPLMPIELEYDAAHAVLVSIIYQIDGGTLPTGETIAAHPIEDLLVRDNKSVGIREYLPWALKSLYDNCDENIDLARFPWGTLLDQRMTFCDWFENYLDGPSSGEDELESYLTMLETHLPDISEDRWFEGYERSTKRACPPPVPPPSPAAEAKQEKSGMRFEIVENTPEGCTTYHDLILDASYVISNRTKAKKVIDSQMIADLKNGVKQWNVEWKMVKGAFQRDDGARFNADQIIHEAKPNFMGEKTEQYTGRWRIRTDEEMSEWAKAHGPSQKAKMTV